VGGKKSRRGQDKIKKTRLLLELLKGTVEEKALSQSQNAASLTALNERKKRDLKIRKKTSLRGGETELTA